VFIIMFLSDFPKIAKIRGCRNLYTRGIFKCGVTRSGGFFYIPIVKRDAVNRIDLWVLIKKQTTMRYLELAMPIIIVMGSLFGIIQMVGLREWLFVLFFLAIFGMAVSGAALIIKEIRDEKRRGCR